MSDMIDIRVSRWDSGCLEGLLIEEIRKVDQRLRVLGGQLGDREKGEIGAYGAQLRACLDALRKARV